MKIPHVLFWFLLVYALLGIAHTVRYLAGL